MGNRMLSYWYKLYMKQTSSEIRLENYVCKLGVRYRTQHPVLSCAAFLDFYFPDSNLAVEVDDPGHLKVKQAAKDKERTAKLNKKGIRVVRFTNAQVVNDMDYVLEVIKGEL